MDINEFLNKNFSKEELDKIFVPPNQKIESLVELIDKAKQSKE
jgi:hypothetical protein